MPILSAARLLSFIVPFVLLGGALISEYAFGLFPCEMCYWQRWPHEAAIILALLALIFAKKSWSQILIALAAIAIGISGLIGGFHAGVEYGWWEGLTECAITAGPSGGDLLESIMNAPIIRCDVAQWSLFGISLAGWNFLLSIGGMLTIFGLLGASKKARAIEA